MLRIERLERRDCPAAPPVTAVSPFPSPPAIGGPETTAVSPPAVIAPPIVIELPPSLLLLSVQTVTTPTPFQPPAGFAVVPPPAGDGALLVALIGTDGLPLLDQPGGYAVQVDPFQPPFVILPPR